ncbi:MAG: pectinesterase family protein [Kiritimatiellia bacterium]
MNIIRNVAFKVRAFALICFIVSMGAGLVPVICCSGEPAGKVVVAADGSGDFTCITAAIASVKNATQSSPVDIIIRPGVYTETIRTRNWVNLVGEDRDKCVITYDSGAKSNIHLYHTIAATSHTRIKNLTLVGKTVKYVIHSDGGREYLLEIENCTLRREYPSEESRQYKAAFGIGLHAGQHIVMSNCLVEADLPVFLHNWNDQEVPCSMTIEKCALNGKENALFISLLGSKQRDFCVVHDSVLAGAKASINYTNMCIRKLNYVGENEMLLLGSGNTMTNISGTKMEDDSGKRLSGAELCRRAPPAATPADKSVTQPAGTNLAAGGVFRFGEHEGYLLVPPGYNAEHKYPLIVHFHGRGGSHIKSNLMTEGFAQFREKALTRGYFIATPDYGSSCWLNAAAEDLSLECIEHVKKTLSIDHNRVYLLGCSMGGGAALTFAGRHPEKIAAVCDVFGVSDFERLYRSGRYCQSIAAAYGGTPDEKPEVYRERSGISYIEQLKNIPLLVIHGDKDGTVPFWNSQVLVDKLQAAGGMARLIVVPGKGHDNSIIMGLEDTVLDYFDSNVKK